MPRTQVALEQCPGIVACSADPGFVSVSEQALSMLGDCVTAGFAHMRPCAMKLPIYTPAAHGHVSTASLGKHSALRPATHPPARHCALSCFQGVTTPERKPLTAADGAARVLQPLMAWSSGRLPEDTLANVLVWKDFLPLRVVPAAKQALWALRMHPLAAAFSGGPSETAAARGSAGAAAGSAGKLGEPEVVQSLGGWKVSRSASMSSAWQCRAPLPLLSLLPPTCSGLQGVVAPCRPGGRWQPDSQRRSKRRPFAPRSCCLQVSMVVGGTLREVGPFAEDSAAQLARDFIASELLFTCVAVQETRMPCCRRIWPDMNGQ